MSLTGYRLAGTAKSAASGYIPSLIGVGHQQIEPAGTDAYFEQVDLPAEAINLNSASLTKWVTYDGLPSTERDPIIAAKAAGLGFYIPLSELEAAAEFYDNAGARAIVATLRKASRT